MYEEKNELANWFKDYRNSELEKVDSLETILQYGKGISSLCEEAPKISNGSPSYNIVQIDKDLELYTLLEATNTDVVGNILENVFKGGVVPESENKIEAILRSNINSGIICYAQPKISESGDLLENNIEFETTIPDGAFSDTFIVIAKTGARVNINHKYLGNNNSFLGRIIILICEDSSMIKFNENIIEANGSIYNQYINIIGPASNITFSGILKSLSNARLKSEYFLLGEGSNCSSDLVAIAKDNDKYDISCAAHLKSESSHASIHSACVSYDSSHVIYQEGITSEEEVEGSVDEAKLLFVGENSRIDSLPIKDSRVVRYVSQSHIDEVDDIKLQQLFGRVIDADLLKKALE